MNSILVIAFGSLVAPNVAAGGPGPWASVCGALCGNALAPQTDEGALRNTTPLPSDPAAAGHLRRGDEALAQLRARLGETPPSAADWNGAFDGWRAALTDSAAGAGVLALDPGAPQGLFPDPDGTLDRRAEGVPVAVLRRLASLSAAARAAWRARIDTEAEAALTAAGRDQARLARVERDFPLARAAAAAALRLADLALEQGRPVSAEVHLGRALTHGFEGVAGDPRFVAALTTRHKYVGALRDRLGPGASAAPHATSGAPTPTPFVAPFTDSRARAADLAAALQGTTTLIPRRMVRLERARRSALAPLGRDVQPGLVELSDGSLVVQTARAVVLLDPAAARGEPQGEMRVEGLDRLVDIGASAALTSPSAGGWPLMPATDGQRFAFVIGRGAPGRRFRDLPLPARGNTLAVFERGDEGLRPQLVWQLGDLGRQRPGVPAPPPTEVVRGPDGEPWPSGYEFQPGPLAADGALFVLARRLSDPTATPDGAVPPDTLRLFRFELATGDLDWWRDITRGSELGEEASRGADNLGVATAAAPLALHGGAIVVATNVGVTAAYDAADGRLAWAFRNQRRLPGNGGWAGSRPPLGSTKDSPQGPESARECVGVWCTPFDSDFAYHVALRPGFPDAGRFWLEPPLARGASLDLVATGGAEGLLTASRAGRHASLERWAPPVEPGGLRSREVLCYLGEGEGWSGRALASRGRALVPGDRALRLVDLERGGLVIASVPFEQDGGTPLGGDVHLLSAEPAPSTDAARRSPRRVIVLGLDALWLFELR